ncbi:MAG TPA: hypothetical protein VHP55_05360 [Usitatibacter sp.]|nr:hypothetical protein [Usitatibacter sp.]
MRPGLVPRAGCELDREPTSHGEIACELESLHEAIDGKTVFERSDNAVHVRDEQGQRRHAAHAHHLVCGIARAQKAVLAEGERR